jgi:hypothetical protein
MPLIALISLVLVILIDNEASWSHQGQKVAFEWDSEKAAKNERKHGVGFHEAATVLGDPLQGSGSFCRGRTVSLFYYPLLVDLLPGLRVVSIIRS